MHKKIKTERLSILKQNNNRNKIMVKIHIEIHDNCFSSSVSRVSSIYILFRMGFFCLWQDYQIVCLYH